MIEKYKLTLESPTVMTYNQEIEKDILLKLVGRIFGSLNGALFQPNRDSCLFI